MATFPFTWSIFSIFFALISENLYSATGKENEMPGNDLKRKLTSVTKDKKQNKRTCLTKLQKAAIGTTDIRNCFKSHLTKRSEEYSAEIVDSGSTTIETSSSFERQPLAQLVTYDDSYLAQISNTGESMLFKHQISAEAWIKKMLAKQNVSQFEKESANSALPASEFDQIRSAIIAKNPFALADEIIAKFEYSSLSTQTQPLDDGRFLARFLINPEIQHHAFKYFCDLQSAESWLADLSRQYTKKPVLTQKQKKKRKEELRLMKRL